MKLAVLIAAFLACLLAVSQGARELRSFGDHEKTYAHHDTESVDGWEEALPEMDDFWKAKYDALHRIFNATRSFHQEKADMLEKHFESHMEDKE